jgi:drug/metabolite transporter (DMT)-like permease
MNLSGKAWQWMILIILAFIWGSSFILMKKGLISFDNNQVASFRLFFSFLFFIPFIIPRIRKINRHNIRSLLIVGIIGNGLPAFLFTKAQTQIDSSIAGILNSLTPLSALIIGLIFYKSGVKIINILGVLLGFIGAFGLIYQGSLTGGQDQNNWYALFVVVATICYGISVNEVKHKLEDLDGLSIAAFSFLFTGPLGGLYLLFSDLGSSFSNPYALQSLGFVMILAVFGSFLAMILFNILIKYTTAIFGASVTYIIPIFAVFWGLFDGEKLSLDQFFWIIVILIGVYLVNKKKLVEISAP